MAYAEKRGKQWRARYRRPDGTWASEPGFETKQSALEYGRDQEAAIRRREWKDPKLGEISLKDWVDQWLEALDVGPNTAAQYRSLLRNHILPRWGAYPLNAITYLEVESWLTGLRGGGGRAQRRSRRPAAPRSRTKGRRHGTA